MTRGLLRREVLVVCAVAFLCDVMSGIIIPTFSLYAKSLGASLVLVGALTTLSALIQLVISVPVGLLSDRVGRRKVLLLGLGSFGAAMVLFAVAPNAYALIPGRLLLGLAMVSTFWIAAIFFSSQSLTLVLMCLRTVFLSPGPRYSGNRTGSTSARLCSSAA